MFQSISAFFVNYINAAEGRGKKAKYNRKKSKDLKRM